jgi:hypothetical protein
MINAMRIATNVNTSYDSTEVLSLVWLHESLMPGALPLVGRNFQYNPKLREDLLEDLEKEDFRPITDFEGLKILFHDGRQLCVELNAQSQAILRGRGSADVLELRDRLKSKYGQETVSSNPLKLLVEGKESYSLTDLSTPAETLQEENYAPEVLKKFEYLSKQLTADKPKGRIGVLSGYPGTGKTYLLRAILNKFSEKTDFVLINTEQCVNLGRNLHKFMQMLASRSGMDKKRKLVLILEDADSAIAPRSANNLSAIQSILNFGDGLMGEALDIRLLVTTNVRTVEIDPAILRAGRLISHIEVCSLQPTQANAVFKRLTGIEGNYNKTVTIAQVYDDAGKLEEAQEALAAE